MARCDYRIVEAIEDCEEASKVDPSFVKVHTRRGRALLKLGLLDEAADAFAHVLGWTQQYDDRDSADPNDDNGKDVARQAMKQVVLAKTLRDRLRNASASDAKQSLQTAEELLQLCPFMRYAQAHKARAMCQLHQWGDAKQYMEFCVCSVHRSMQKLTAHPAAELSSLDMEALSWREVSYGIVGVDLAAVKTAMLVMGPAMARSYLITLKNMDKCRSNCSADIMSKIAGVLGNMKEILCRLSGSTPPDESWDWVMVEYKMLRQIISLKNDADEKFRKNLFEDAIQRYTDVLKVWQDISHCFSVTVSSRQRRWIRMHTSGMPLCMAIALLPRCGWVSFTRPYWTATRA